MRRGNFRIYKANGQLEKASRQKLHNSLRRSGLSNRAAANITDKVREEIGEGTRTRDIYRKSLKLVKDSSPVAAVHYSLKRSLFELGPSGHYFEDFVARYFTELGYATKTCLTLQGKWVKHEVDVEAKKDGNRFLAECKFHNRHGIKNDIKIALYVKARWDDLREGPDEKVDGFYLASNTAFTSDAIRYAEGVGLKLLGVNAPPEESFLDQIKRLNLYPITSLRRLNKHMKGYFISQKIILAREIPENIHLLLKLGLRENDIASILEEIELLKENQT